MMDIKISFYYQPLLIKSLYKYSLQIHEILGM